MIHRFVERNELIHAHAHSLVIYESIPELFWRWHSLSWWRLHFFKVISFLLIALSSSFTVCSLHETEELLSGESAVSIIISILEKCNDIFLGGIWINLSKSTFEFFVGHTSFWITDLSPEEIWTWHLCDSWGE